MTHDVLAKAKAHRPEPAAKVWLGLRADDWNTGAGFHPVAFGIQLFLYLFCVCLLFSVVPFFLSFFLSFFLYLSPSLSLSVVALKHDSLTEGSDFSQ